MTHNGTAPRGPAIGAPRVLGAPTLRIRALFARFWPDARPYRGWIIAGVLTALIIPIVEAAEIWMFKLVVDEVLVPGELEPLIWIGAATIGIVITGGVLSFVDEYVASWVGEKFLINLRTRVFGHLMRTTPDELERRHMGDTLSRVTSDVARVEGIVLSGVGEFGGSLVRILVFGGILFYLDWVLALVSLVAAPVLWLLAGRFSRRIRDASRDSRRSSGALASVGEESLANAALVQAHDLVDTEVERFRDQGEKIMKAELVSARIRALFGPLVDLLELGAALVVIGLGTWSVASGRLTLGGLLVFITYVTQLYSPIRELATLATSIFSAAAAAERVSDILDRPAGVPERHDARTLTHVTGEVRLDAVTFRYPGTSRVLLRGANLTVSPGEVVAVTGPNGSGKSTIAKLLGRFVDPDEGAVRLDGHDLRDLALADYRRHVTLLFQEALTFHGTVRENLLLGRPGADDATLWDALDSAGARHFVEGLPDGIDTVVGQRGRHLSGGQRQMLGVARAVLRDTPVLILDEPTTGLDVVHRAQLREPLKRLLKGRTTIIITHDQELRDIADRVVDLRDGQLIPVVGAMAGGR